MGENMKKHILIALFAMISSSAFAAGDAGCGLGSMIISKNSKGLQLLAMTTNGSFLSQPLGITSGTSNCSASGIVSNDKAIEYYVEANQNDILKEMSMGSGEKLETLAALYGCQSEAGKAQFKAMTKSEFILINKNSATSQEWLQNLNTVIDANKDKVSNCASI